MSRNDQSPDAQAPQESSVPCLIEGCVNPARTRGLCNQCYAAATRKVKEGAITWAELIELGLARPSSRETGAREKFDTAFRKLKGDSKPNPSQEPAENAQREAQAKGRSIRKAPDDQAGLPVVDVQSPVIGTPTLPWQQ